MEHLINGQNLKLTCLLLIISSEMTFFTLHFISEAQNGGESILHLTSTNLSKCAHLHDNTFEQNAEAPHEI